MGNIPKIKTIIRPCTTYIKMGEVFSLVFLDNVQNVPTIIRLCKMCAYKQLAEQADLRVLNLFSVSRGLADFFQFRTLFGGVGVHHGVISSFGSAKVCSSAIFETCFSLDKDIWVAATDYYMYFYIIVLFFIDIYSPVNKF